MEFLRSLARTTAIVMLLGVAFYIMIAGMAGQPDAAFWLVLLLAAPFGMLLGYLLFDAFRSGRIAVGREAIIRADDPVRFKVWIAWFGVMKVLLLALCLYAASRLMG